MKITIVGAGYVGMSLAVLISEYHEVKLLDIDSSKIKKINNKQSPIKDLLVKDYLAHKNLLLSATIDKTQGYRNADYIIICAPTNYNIETGMFDTSKVENIIIDVLKENREASIIIKSTLPVGFTEKIKKKYNYQNIYFSPEFLREGNALYDNLHPSRIIIGNKSDNAKKFAELLSSCALKSKESITIKYMSSSEAEAVKLFSNTYLAMRISFFNELDSYAETKSLDVKKIINGVGLDNRIGNYYNNPSFGYGGYCLPKDTKQLLKNYDQIPNKLITAIVEANITRKEYIVNQIIKRKPKIVGIYRLAMKLDSDNFRDSAVIDIIKQIVSRGIEVIIFEPNFKEELFFGIKVIKESNKFFKESDLILANRASKELDGFIDKVYTRDIFREN